MSLKSSIAKKKYNRLIKITLLNSLKSNLGLIKDLNYKNLE